jgi:hypothetical protein
VPWFFTIKSWITVSPSQAVSKLNTCSETTASGFWSAMAEPEKKVRIEISRNTERGLDFFFMSYLL